MSLPSGYKQLEYIQSSGTQYINTGFIPKSTSKVFADFQVTEKRSKNNDIFGVVGQFSFRQYANSDFFRTVCGSAADFETSVSILTRHVVEKTMTETKIDGLYSVSTDASTVSNAIFLFAYNAGSYVSNYGHLKLYSCQICDNDVLVRDFVPCIKDDGEVGLYDLAGKQFYGNAGTGTFTAGPVIAIAADESEITKLKYIQSSGKQYIKTGFVPNQDTRIVYDCYRETASAADYFFGVRTGNTTKNAFNFYIYNSGWRSGYNSTTTSVNGPSTGRYLIDKDKNVTYINGKTLGTATYASFTSGGEAYLFAMQNVGRGIAYGSHRLYSCQIYDNGTIVRDYIPAKLSDGTVGLYDKLNGLLYINAGTGTFISGGYALNLPVNIGGTWKNANEVFVNIGGTWKTVESAFVNIDGTWKELG